MTEPQNLQDKNTETEQTESLPTQAPQVQNTASESKTSEPVAPIVIQQKTGGNALAIGAITLSLIALGASGFLFVQGQNTLKTQELRLTQDLNKAALGNSENAILLQNSLQKQQDIDADLNKILQNEADAKNTLEGVQRAYAEFLKGRVNWLVDEVEVTLNVASQQLLLSGNVPVAVAVLENVEARLNRFEQPELLPIKQAISQDLSAMKNRPYLNVSATALRLDRLESAVAGLPLLVDGTLKETNAEVAPVSQAGNFWTRAWDNTVALVKSMVEVRHLDSNDAMLIAPEQVYFVRENVRLRLLDARLALLQHNGEVFQNDLNAIEATVKQYFDINSPNAQAWLQELTELKALEIRMVSDDALKTSLAAVRDYQNNVKTALPIVIPEITVPAVMASSSSAVEPKVQAASLVAPVAASESKVEAIAASAASEAKTHVATASAASEPVKGKK